MLPMFVQGSAAVRNIGTLAQRPNADAALFGLPFWATDTLQLFQCVQITAAPDTFAWEAVAEVAGNGGWYGDGSDGTGLFDGTTTVQGIAPIGNVYTLTRDLVLSSALVSSGVTVKLQGFKLFALTGIANVGTISSNGNAGVTAASNAGGAPGAASNAGSTGQGTAGGAGAAGNAVGTGGTVSAAGFPNAAANAGQGGNGGQSGANAGGSGGAITALVATKGTGRTLMALTSGMTFGSAGVNVYIGGSGGGGGAGSGAADGGGGGGGGAGVSIVASPLIVNTGSIIATGGVGGGGLVATNSGGGAGGGGGVNITVSRVFQGNLPTALGGAPGASTGTAQAAQSGNFGTVIQAQA